MLAESIKPFTAWLHLHPHWGVFAAFIVAFLESFAVIGSIIPGSVTLTAIGVLVGSGVIPATATLLFAIVGAVLGDTLSYWIGHHYHERIKTLWPLSKYPALLSRGEQFFHRHGGKSILVARFIGPIRAILPLVAGMLNMPFMRFFIADTIGGILWAPAYMLPGILVGAATLELPPEAATRLILYLLLGLVFIWLFAVLIHKISARLFQYYDAATGKLWAALKQRPHYHWLVFALQDPKQNNGHGQLLLGVSALLFALMFLILAINVFFQTALIDINAPAFHLFQSIREAQLDNWMVALTFFGDKVVVLSFALLLSAYLFYQGYRRAAIHLLITCVLASGAVLVFKPLIASARPTGFMVVRASYSFPSGHSTLASAIYGFLIFLFVGQIHKPYKRYWAMPMLGFISIILISRLYLGAHWLTDVIGGALLGFSVALVSTISLRRSPSKTVPMLSSCLVALALLLAPWSAYTLSHFHKQRYAYTAIQATKTLELQQWWQQAKPLLPLYRYNRLGAPIAHCNVQWLASLDSIKKQLSAHGWTVVNNHSLLGLLGRVVAKDKSQTLPVFPQLMHNRPPVLVMTKSLKPNWPILVLRLWDPLTVIKNSQSPLWLGALQYRIIWKHRWLESHRAILKSLPEAKSILAKSLKDRPHRRVVFHTTQQYKAPRNQSDVMSILLIRE